MSETSGVWGAPRRIAYLVLVVFLMFHTVVPLLSMVPYLGWYASVGYDLAWFAVIPWIGEHVLGFPYPVEYSQNGSGDTSWHWVQMFGVVVLSLVGGIVWALLDHKRTSYAGINRWVMVLTRYTLSAAMAGYGLAKVFKSQFPFPHLASLTTTTGDSSPMGLAWRFMGYSEGYNYFTGGAECLAALLLLSRRTATLGALVAVGVTANIVALNFFYDIPVKLYSSTLLLMGLYLAACDGRRLLDLFVRNRPTEAAVLTPYFERKWARITRVALKSVFGLLLALSAVQSWFIMGEWGDRAPKPPLWGLYEAESFTRNGEVRPPLITDELRWRHFIVERFRVMVRTMDGKREGMGYELDQEARTFKLTRAKEGEEPREETLQYEETEAGLVVRGNYGGDEVVVTLKRVDLNSFLLINRGFRWINEEPFNR